MNPLAVLLVLSFVGMSFACTCDSVSWAQCEGDPCQCYVTVGKNEREILNCSALIPKCFLMKAEMYKKLHKHFRGMPVDTALVDNDGPYDPECESNGLFKAKQCNNSEECWCVNSAGVRRSDKGDKNLKCEELVETYWIHVELKHKATPNPVEVKDLQRAIAAAIQERYKISQNLITSVSYDGDARLITVDVKKPLGDRKEDLSRMAYYMEKDVKAQPLLASSSKFEPNVAGQKLEMENILVYYVDEKAPTITMQRLTGGIVAVIVVVILAVLVGLLVLFIVRRRNQSKYVKAQEMEEIQPTLS
ncbi:epithelial cell adhesion molecule-like [Chanos chanos]|uniref:Epithelial cell adhesion molecule-like n=1 Tax=Chanos chanos TaxID=29144 RepID=A0A6J2VJR0_CHACN|nr:epithelial cell adhesion molecule-like [Chanos chanos]